MTCGQLILALLLSLALTQGITHLNNRNFEEKVNTHPFTFVYFYSSSCTFCQKFTPIFEKTARNSQILPLNISFAKIDGPAYQNLTRSYEAFSYPTLGLFWRGVNLPLIYRSQRTEKQLVKWLVSVTQPGFNPKAKEYFDKMPLADRHATKSAMFYGKADSYEFSLFDIVTKRDGYVNWGFVEADTPRAVIGNIEVTDFTNFIELEATIAKAFARLHSITEESWLKMADKKKFTIFYINKHGNKKTKELLSRLAREIPDVHFMEVDGEHDEYKPALRFLGINDEENIVSVDKLYDAMYMAPHPYTEAALKEFIEKARTHKLELYRKTEIVDKPNKLTRNNFEEKMGTDQDVLLFVYDKKEQISKELMKLFEFLIYKLKPNKNLLLLRCDIGLNEIEEKLGFVVKPTPRIVFLRNKMKDYAIHFSGQTISAESVLKFVEENTTFDFEEQWAEL